MGWTGTSLEMIAGDSSTKSDFYQTSNLEKLATRGMVFSQAYSAASLCTPSRAAILTGKTPAELHITTPGGGRRDTSHKVTTPQTASGLPDDIPTIGTLLKAEGYATALLGKWHIGRNDHAGKHGFDLHDGSTENESKGTPDNPKEICSLTERGIAFMEEQVKAGKPFYLQLSHYAVHAPTQTKPESLARFKKLPSGGIHIESNFAGMTWDFDSSLSQIFEALNQLKIEDNTYVVFMSDNGAPGNRRIPNNTPLSAGKGTLYEGGIRVPFIVTGPGIASSATSAEAVTGCDLLPTFCSWAGIAIPGDIEGQSLATLLSGKSKKIERTKPLLFHYPHYGQGPAQKPQTAIIEGNLKLLRDLETGDLQLFDLSSDLSEKNDLSKKYPEKTEKLEKLMDQRLKETDAQMPTENPAYDPTKDQSGQRRQRNR
jgi:arylsulfatase A-like enzyme